MHRSRLHRRLVALCAMTALVLAQALVAAHGCVLPAPADAAVAPCHHESDAPASDTLCKAHCEAGTQTIDQAKPLPTPALGAPLLVLRTEDPAHTGAGPTVRLTDWLAHAGAPPPLLLHRRLRI